MFEELGWEDGDKIVVKVGGTVVSGIHQPPNANPKWTLPFGKRRYNKDAFIVIENQSRRETDRSQAMASEQLHDEFYDDGSGQLYKKRELVQLPEPSPMGDSRISPWLQIMEWLRSTLFVREGENK